VVAGAYVQSNGELSDYTSAGESLNASLTCWPTCTAPGDESRSLPGLLVAGTRSGTLVRMNGTSVAVPQIARALLASRVQNIVVPPLPSNAPVAGMPAARGGSRRLVYP
jgi:hypothetical protein